MLLLQTQTNSSDRAETEDEAPPTNEIINNKYSQINKRQENCRPPETTSRDTTEGKTVRKKNLLEQKNIIKEMNKCA